MFVGVNNHKQTILFGATLLYDETTLFGTTLLYLEQEKWALVYGREIFCVDITTTQRSESMNNAVKVC